MALAAFLTQTERVDVQPFVRTKSRVFVKSWKWFLRGSFLLILSDGSKVSSTKEDSTQRKLVLEFLKAFSAQDVIEKKRKKSS